MAVAALVVVATSDKEVVADPPVQVRRAVCVALMRVEVLLLRQVVTAEVGCGAAEAGCGAAEVAAAVLLSDRP
jgi:hypothetical protein